MMNRRTFLEGVVFTASAVIVPRVAAAAPGVIFVFDQPNQRWLSNYNASGLSFVMRSGDPVRVLAATDEMSGIYPVRDLLIDARALRIRIVDPEGHVHESPSLGPLTVTIGEHIGSAWQWAVPALPDGPYLITTDQPRTLEAAVLVKNSSAPCGSAFVAVGCINNFGDAWTFPKRFRGGFAKVVGPPRGAPMTPRIGTPFTERLPYDELWTQRMTQTRRAGFNRWVCRTPHGDYIDHPVNRFYNQVATRDRFVAGALRDGYRNQACVQAPVDGVILSNGTLIGLDAAGRLFSTGLDGYTATIVGYRQPIDVPIPRQAQLLDTAGGSPSDKADRRQAYLESAIELVGTWTDGPSGFNQPFAVCVTADERTAYVADADNHRVVQVDLVAGRAWTLAGSRAAEPGYRDGRSGDARFDGPRGIMLTADRRLLVADDRNSAIREIHADGSVSTVLTAPTQPTIDDLRTHGFDTPEAIFDMRGHYGMASSPGKMPATGQGLLHPNHIQLDSRGRWIIACHHTFQVIRYDPTDHTLEWLADLPAGNIRNGHLETDWITLSVDRWGACGPVDDIAVTAWDQNTARRWTSDGVPVGYRGDDIELGRTSNFTVGRRGSPVFDGPMHETHVPGYPHMTVFGADGSVWMSGNAVYSLFRYTRRRASDPPFDRETYERGWDVYCGDGPASCALELIHGVAGADQYGGQSFDDVAAMTDAEIASVIRNAWQRPDILGADLAALIYYIRWNAKR